MPRETANAYDAFRQELRDAIDKVGKDLKSLSEGAGKNHSYLQQFITKGVPQELPERVRDYVANEIGLDPLALKQQEIVWKVPNGDFDQTAHAPNRRSGGRHPNKLSDRGRDFVSEPDQWSTPESFTSDSFTPHQKECVLQIVRVMTFMSAGANVSVPEAAVNNFAALIFQAAAVTRNRDRLGPLLCQACQSALGEYLTNIEAPQSRFDNLNAVLGPGVELLLATLHTDAPNTDAPKTGAPKTGAPTGTDETG